MTGAEGLGAEHQPGALGNRRGGGVCVGVCELMGRGGVCVCVHVCVT